jgi:exosortase/archaeosortase family protein
MDVLAILWNVVLFAGLIALAAGYFERGNRCHLYRILGLLLLAVFFSGEVVRIIREGKDLWNVTFTALTPPIFLFVAWQEWLSYTWHEDHRSLRWLVGTAWIAGLIYYTFARIPVMTAGLVYLTASQTIWFGQMFGYGLNFKIGAINWADDPLSVGIKGSPVNIILGCTGIEAIVIFVGAILATQLEADPWAGYRDADSPKFLRYRAMSGRERVTRALLYTLSIIWVGNLVRNVGIIYLVDVKGWDFDVVHGDIGKGSSFIILLVLAFVTFNLLPEMLDNISGLYDLRARLSPEERAAVEAEKAAKEKAEKERAERENAAGKGLKEGGVDGKDGKDGKPPPGGSDVGDGNETGAPSESDDDFDA